MMATARAIALTVVLAAALTACGQRTDDHTSRPISGAFGRATVEKQPTFPQPDDRIEGELNPDAPPDVARHVARQERCAHWRAEAAAGNGGQPAVTAGLDQECRGLDEELRQLRSRHADDGAAIRALGPYRETGSNSGQ